MNDSETMESNMQKILSKMNDLELKIQGMANQIDAMGESQRKLEKKLSETERSLMASITSYSEPCRYVG